MKRLDGVYSRRPAAEIEALIEAYNRAGNDDTGEDTAVESPKAISETKGPPKRSGEYLINLEREFQNRLDDERRLAASKIGRG